MQLERTKAVSSITGINVVMSTTTYVISFHCRVTNIYTGSGPGSGTRTKEITGASKRPLSNLRKRYIKNCHPRI